MKVEVLKTFYHDKLGRVEKGSVVELSDSQANMFLEKNAVRRYDTKVVREIPLENAGVDTQSSALPVEEASQPMTLPKLKAGAKKTKAVEL